ncbi:phage terminase small subunit [Streptomyces collinus]
MGARGPIPNREDDLARPRSRKGSDEQETKKGQMRPVRIPRADPDWHPIAKELYDSLKKSGQADFYQQSDWAYAKALIDDLSHYKKSGKRSAQMAQTIYSALGNLLVTEGDRRRVRIELQEPEPEETPAAVLAIADYKKDLGVE